MVAHLLLLLQRQFPRPITMHFLVDTMAGMERGLRARSMAAYDHLLRTMHGGGLPGDVTDAEGRALVVADHLLSQLRTAAADTDITPALELRDFTFHELSPDEVDKRGQSVQLMRGRAFGSFTTTFGAGGLRETRDYSGEFWVPSMGKSFLIGEWLTEFAGRCRARATTLFHSILVDTSTDVFQAYLHSMYNSPEVMGICVHVLSDYAGSVTAAFKVPVPMFAPPSGHRPEMACLADLEATEKAPANYMVQLRAAARSGTAHGPTCSTGVLWRTKPETEGRKLLRPDPIHVDQLAEAMPSILRRLRQHVHDGVAATLPQTSHLPSCLRRVHVGDALLRMALWLCSRPTNDGPRWLTPTFFRQFLEDELDLPCESRRRVVFS